MLPVSADDSTPAFATAPVGRGCVLDSRRALWHPGRSWLAVSDLHHGFELNSVRKLEVVQPHWRMGPTEQRLVALIDTYKPHTLVLNGDIMDGGGSMRETTLMIKRLRDCVAELVLVDGNHDRVALKREQGFVAMHRIDEFVFHHGHKWGRLWRDIGEDIGVVHVCGHEHPTVQITDGADMKLRLPSLVQDAMRAKPGLEHWILPAFSPWAGGAKYESANKRLGTWACGDRQILPLHDLE